MTAEAPAVPLGIRLLNANTALWSGGVDDALVAFRALVADAPAMCQARYGLASALMAAGAADDAARALDQARAMHAMEIASRTDLDIPRCHDDPAYAVQVAGLFYDASMVAVASVFYGIVAASGGHSLGSLITYGLSLHHQGRAEEAILVFRAAADIGGAAAAEFVLPAHFPAVEGVVRHAAEAKRWGARFAAPVPEPAFLNGPADGRRLRIGYVAPSFTGTQARQFLVPLIANHDPETVEVFLYPQVEEPADFGRPVNILPIGGLSDDDAAAAIRGDEIDVLVDTWGHNAGGRLPMFALRPAPVQVSWLNYMQTTGVAAIDWTLHSDTVDQVGMQDLFCEKIWRMGPTSAPFRPDRPPSIVPTPMARNGYPTFASFNHPSKLTPTTIALWSRILNRVPEAQLVLKYRYFKDPVLQAATAAQFAAHGIDPFRLQFQEHSTGEAYVAAFERIDLALDPTPAPGGTTTMEALAHGVPALTMAGDTYYSRIGVELLAGAGLPDLIAYSPDEYVDKAVAIATNAGVMQAVRERVAPGFAAAPYRDEAAVARRFEASFREMFDLWSHGRQTDSISRKVFA